MANIDTEKINNNFINVLKKSDLCNDSIDYYLKGRYSANLCFGFVLVTVDEVVWASWRIGSNALGIDGISTFMVRLYI